MRIKQKKVKSGPKGHMVKKTESGTTANCTAYLASLANTETISDEEEGSAVASISSTHKAVCEAIAKDMNDLKTERKKELSDFQGFFKDDMKAHLDNLVSDINERLKYISGQNEETTQRVEEVRKKLFRSEEWDVGLKDTLIDLLNNQQELRNKFSELETQSRGNNV